MRHLSKAHSARRIGLVAILAALALLVAGLSPVALAWANEGQAFEGPMGSVSLVLGDGSGDAESDMVGGTVALYRIASVNQETMRFDLSGGQFADEADGPLGLSRIVQMDTEELDAENEAYSEALELLVEQKGIEPYAIVGIAGGKADFSEVPQGLFLVTQPDKSQGERKMNAFILSVPDEEGALDVIAKPKSGIDTPEPTPTPPPQEEDTPPSSSTERITPASPSQAKTTTSTIAERLVSMGDVGVHVLNIVLLGLLALVVGISLRPKREKSDGE